MRTRAETGAPAAGSYDPARTTAGGRAGEIARLDAQAALFFDAELRVYREVGLAAAGTLLEIGCGPGAVTARLRSALPATRIVALDADRALLSRVPADAAARVAADAARLPIGPARVDAVLLRYVAQHLPTQARGRVLAEARRVLRPGGTVAVVDVDGALWGLADPLLPDVAAVHERAARAQAAAGGDRLVGRRLTRLLRAAGFDRVGLRPFAVTSDERPLADFAPLLGPDRLAPLVASGELTPRDLALAAGRWRRFQRDPDAWVMLLGFVAYGRADADLHPDPGKGR